MSAPKRTQANTPYPSKAQASFRAKVLGYPGAKAAFEKLANSRFDTQLLWDLLWRLAQAKRDFTSARRRAPRRWYALPGFPPHTLRRLPDQLVRMANDIEKLNKRIQSDGVFRAAVEFLPAIAKASVSESRDLDLRSLDKLPELLRHYGDYIAVVDRLVALFAPKAVTRDKAMRVELPEAARKLTGKPHYEEVSALLTAAYAAFGSDEIVDPRALQMQHKRRASRSKCL